MYYNVITHCFLRPHKILSSKECLKGNSVAYKDSVSQKRWKSIVAASQVQEQHFPTQNTTMSQQPSGKTKLPEAYLDALLLPSVQAP